MATVRDKAALRTLCKAYRANLSPTDYSRRSRQICVRAAQLSALREAQVIHAYWPAISRREIDIRPLVMFLRAMAKKVVLPVVIKDAPAPTLLSVPFESEAHLRPNRWGILEPAGGQPVDRSAIDAVIVPALAADQRGVRLGYGGGFYDAYLAGMRATVVCPVYDACTEERLVAEPHDISVHVLITETRTLHCGAPDCTPDQAVMCT